MSGTSATWWRRKPKTAQQRYEERRERRRRQMGHGLLPINLESIADHDNLYDVYQKVRRGGPAPGLDDVTYDDLSNSEVGEILRKLAQAILDHSYRPHPTRSVLIPKPGKAGFRELKIGVLCDRIVAAALRRRLNSLWESTFLSCSYGFRENYSPWRMLAELDVQMVRQDRWVLAIDDLNCAFDHVPIEAVLKAHEKMLARLAMPADKEERRVAERHRERLLWLVETVIRGGEPSRIQGIDQGNPYSPTCLNAVLHFGLDEPLLASLGPQPRWFRYADNVVYLARKVSEGSSFLGKVQQLLKPLGMTLKGEDGVQNLARGEEVQLLGFSIKKQGTQVVFSLGKKALDHLAQNLCEAHATSQPVGTARESLLGWMESAGPAYADRGDEIVRVLSVAAEQGFRELASPDEIQQVWRESSDRWQDERVRARGTATKMQHKLTSGKPVPEIEE